MLETCGSAVRGDVGCRVHPVPDFGFEFNANSTKALGVDELVRNSSGNYNAQNCKSFGHC